MKKLFLTLILIASVFMLFGTKVYAAATGNMVVHFQKWDGDYSEIGLNTWGNDAMPGWKTPADITWQTDDFGVFFEVTGLPAGASGTVGIQFVGFDNFGTEEAPDWQANWGRKYANHEIPLAEIIEGETIHVYFFEGSQSREVPTAQMATYFISNPDEYNLLLVYYDPTGNYEEELGIHAWWNAWSSFEEPGWGTPALVFEKAALRPDGTFVMAAMLGASSTDAGLLIYAGGDENKKTGDVKIEEALSAEPALGDVGVAYVLSKGDAYTSNDNVWYNDSTDFVHQAFSFRLVDFDNVSKTGTYAVNPTTIIVKTSQLVENPFAKATTPEEEEAAVALLESWFIIKEKIDSETYGTPLQIERVDFARSNNTLSDFVIILAEGSELDNTKDYVLTIDLQLEENNLEASIELDLDRSAPVLTFITASIAGKPAEERIIEVAWGQPFNQNLFPRYRVQDDRDGDLTPFVFVPPGQFAILDTRVEGDYTIMLRVEDAWGNVTEETFIFRVVRN